jgi:hypothetical protein
MAVISSGNHPKLLWPGIKRIWGTDYTQRPKEWSEFLDQMESDGSYEEDVETTGFGLAPVKSEGSAVTYDSHAQGVVTRYTNVAYALGYIVTKEEIADDKYPKVAAARTKSLAFSIRTTEETVGANLLNRGFTSGYTFGDTKKLFATDHPTLDGTQSNTQATAADFSEAALEDMLIQINNAKNTRGFPIGIIAKKLIIPPNLMFDVERVLKSTNRPDTPNNDVNANRSMGMLPGGYAVNHYLTDTDAWFVKTDCPNGWTRYNRVNAEFTKDNDFDTENEKAKAYIRFSVGSTDFRGGYGSPGA